MPHIPKVSKVDRKENPEARMSLGDHLRELRNRAVIAAIGILVGAILGWFLFNPVFDLITRPIREAKANGHDISMNFDTVMSSFDIKLKTSIWIGVFVAAPIWMYELWAFVAPGMTRKERRYALGYGVVGLLLFGSGAALGVWILPHAITILTSFIPTSGTGFIQASLYLSFVMRLILVFGVAFLLPEFLVGLNMLGLMKGRTMLKGWRWAVVLIFTFMAFANPLPDPWSMIFMALPITGLYFLACWISIRHDKRVARRRAAEDAALDAALAEQRTPVTVAGALPASEPTAQVGAQVGAAAAADGPGGSEPVGATEVPRPRAEPDAVTAEIEAPAPQPGSSGEDTVEADGSDDESHDPATSS